MTLRAERRRHLRVALKTFAYLYRAQSDGLVRARMSDVSIGGFYCHCDEPFISGEKINCIVSLTSGIATSEESFLRCEVKVVRVIHDTDHPETFGVACHIEHYEIVSSQVLRFQPEN